MYIVKLLIERIDLLMGLTWGQLGNKLYKSAKLNHVPISGQFELTARCNLKCKMCYVCKSLNDKEAIKKERTAAEWISIAKEAREAGMLYLLITGGEVFLRKDFMEIYSEIARLGFHIEIYTNATMITPEIAKALGRIPPSKIGVTLYGASPETYEKVCGNANGFNLAMRGIDLLLSEGITLWLKTTVIKDNVDDFDKIAEYADKLGIQFGIVSYISPRREGCGTCPEDERLSPLELIGFRERADNYFSKKSPQEYVADSEICIVEEEPREIQSKVILSSKTNDAFDCTAGKCSFWITWDGRMTPCALMDEPYTFPFENDFASAWEDVQKQCFLIPVCTECQECSYKEQCMPCPARLKIETGFYNKSAPYLCELTKGKYTEKEVIQE
jgi:MoaA/NifB/PqqE/SkfB family radical SAM enzyme